MHSFADGFDSPPEFVSSPLHCVNIEILYEYLEYFCATLDLNHPYCNSPTLSLVDRTHAFHQMALSIFPPLNKYWRCIYTCVEKDSEPGWKHISTEPLHQARISMLFDVPALYII